MQFPSKIAIFAFRGEGPCFMHAILNAEDMRKKDLEAIVVMEGGSVKIIRSIIDGDFPISIERIKAVVDCACLGCSKMFHVEDLFEKVSIRLEGSMNNHVSVADYLKAGYKIITM